MIKFVKDCVWSFKKRRQPKNIVDYDKGDIVSDISEKVEAEMVDAGYAVYSKEDAASPKGAQTIDIETKDIQTKPTRNSAKTSDDKKSD